MNIDPLTFHREQCLRAQEGRIHAELEARGELAEVVKPKPPVIAQHYTPEQVRDIRTRYASGEKSASILLDHGGSYHCLYRAAVGITYQNVS